MGAEQDLELLKDEYLKLADQLAVDYYESGDPGTFPKCIGGDARCSGFLIEKILDMLDQQAGFAEKQARRATRFVGRRARFFLRVLRWAVRRIDHRLVEAGIRDAALRGEAVGPRSELRSMIGFGKDGRPFLMVGHHPEGFHARYPKHLAHIFKDHVPKAAHDGNGLLAHPRVA